MATTQVLLTENVPGLGAEADIVKVKAGYARNFLLPKGKALEINKSNMRRMTMLKAKRAEREARELNDSEELARRINKLKITLMIETGAQGKAFGSITNTDLAEKLKAELGGTEIDRHKIVLQAPIKGTGSFEIPVKLHPEVTAKFDLTVKSSTHPEETSEEGPAPAAEGAPVEEKEKGGFKAKPKARHKE